MNTEQKKTTEVGWFYETFKKMALMFSEKTAIITEEKKFTYKKALFYIDFLSQYFEKKDKNSCIIWMKKSEWSIWSFLAVNKTKNVFTFLDEDCPEWRFWNIYEQLKTKYVVCDKTHWDVIKKSQKKIYTEKITEDVYVVQFFEEKDTIKCYHDDVSHIYFSSGTTGEPKGILLKDKPVIDVIFEQSRLVNFTENDIFGWVLNPCFDASLSDICIPLFSGGALYIYADKMTSLKKLCSCCENKGITYIDLSPALFSVMKKHLLEKTTTLHTIIFGGELASEATVKELSQKYHMFNSYGPTETTISSSMKKVDENWLFNNIGQPLKHVNYTIDETTQELLISGSHLAIGYLKQELTEQKFIVKNNKRYYKTGDCVYKRNDDYFYQGRLDRQFKHNGVLIAPEEIEHHARLAGCEQVMCVNENKYTLYFTGKIDKEKLMNYMKNHLSAKMCPSVYIHLETLNLNSNGKTCLIQGE